MEKECMEESWYWQSFDSVEIEENELSKEGMHLGLWTKLHLSKQIKIYRCEFCSYTTDLRNSLVRHRRRHTGEKPHVCDDCGRAFIQKGNLTAHLISHHNYPSKYHCRHCAKGFVAFSNLYIHEYRCKHAVQGAEPAVKCLMGAGDDAHENGVFISDLDRPGVTATCHAQDTTVTSCDPQDATAITCDPQDSTVITRDPQDLSATTHHSQGTGVVAICDLQNSALTTYDPPVRGVIRCDSCDFMTTSNENLIRHYRTHTGEKPYLCENCGRAFRCKGTLDSHMRVHTGEKPFECALCGLKFRHSTARSQHIKSVHYNIYDFHCDKCDYKTVGKSKLKQHQIYHHGLPSDHVCKTCGKNFAALSHLRIHLGRCIPALTN